MNHKLLEIRKVMKAKKPNFHVQNSNDPKKRYPGRWKRPKGLQSKMRERRKGNPIYIEPGYGSPAAVRGATPEGFFPVVVSSIADLAKVKEDCGVVISRSVGMKKKVELVKAAVERKLKLLNVDADKFSKVFSDFTVKRKARRQEILQKRKTKGEKPESKKRAEAAKETARQPEPGKDETAAGIESKMDSDEKKKAEKAEKDKFLTKAK